jgi:hypothetical protein
MPRKLRQLRQDLRRAGFAVVPGRGKGDHDWWAHPRLPRAVELDGKDSRDAKHYQERAVAAAVAAVQALADEQASVEDKG